MSYSCFDGFEAVEDVAGLTSEEILAEDRILTQELSDTALLQLGNIHERYALEREALRTQTMLIGARA